MKTETLKYRKLDRLIEEEEARARARLHRAQVFHTLLFCAALFVLGGLSLLLPKPEVSEVEKRELAKMPAFSTEALVKGEYVRGVELYYADTFPLREGFVSFAALINELRGVRFDGVRIYNNAPQQPEQPAPQPPESQPPPVSENPAPEKPGAESSSAAPAESEPQAPQAETPKPHVVPDDGALGEKTGAVFVYKKKAMSIFGGGAEMASWYARTINAYADAWGDSAKVYNLVIPSAIEFALPERYKNVSAPQKPNIDYIREGLSGRVAAVDAYGAMEAHADEYVYFNSDHHWTGLGAYYAYTAFCESAGLEPVPLERFEKRTIENFHGTMYASTADAKLAEDHVDYYLPPVRNTAVRYDKNAPFTPKPHSVFADYAKGGNSYSVFLHGDFPLIRIDTDVANGRKTLVVKESFGNAFAPLLMSHYEQVYVVDQRYFQLGLVDFVKQNGIQDVIFINNIFAANTGLRIQEIERIMYQQYVPPQPAPPPASEAPSSEGASSEAPSSEAAPENGGPRSPAA